VDCLLTHNASPSLLTVEARKVSSAAAKEAAATEDAAARETEKDAAAIEKEIIEKAAAVTKAEADTKKVYSESSVAPSHHHPPLHS
jgi:hypothetical protein